MSDRRGVGDTDFEVQGRKIQSRGSSAGSSLNRCEPRLPNSIPARGVMKATLRGLTHVRSKTPPTNRRFRLPNRGHPHTSSASLYSQRRISPLIDAQAICALAAVTSASAFDRHLSAAIKRGNREEILDHDSGIFSARLQKLKIAGYLADEEHGSFCFPILRSGIIGCSIKINALNPDVPGSFEACKAVALRVMRLVDDEKVNAIRSDRH